MPPLHWHSHAHLPNSSQVFCISAFCRLDQLSVKDKVLSSLFTSVLPGHSMGTWTITPEFVHAQLLGEQGSQQTTSIDALCWSNNAVVAVESKFDRDAAEGFGGCSQAMGLKQRSAKCRGFYGPGSDDATGTPAWCRLENWEGVRAPRLYWAFGKRWFRPEVFRAQTSSSACPLRYGSYQLMRNFLFAAAYAETHHLPYFAVLVLCPRSRASGLGTQVRQFCEEVLLAPYAQLVQLAHYETYIEALRVTGDADAIELAAFLEGRIAATDEG